MLVATPRQLRSNEHHHGSPAHAKQYGAQAVWLSQVTVAGRSRSFRDGLRRHHREGSQGICFLIGAAHSNGYATILRCISGDNPWDCNLANGHGNNNAFAMEWGGGLDIKLSKLVQIRPVEVDYLYTKFSSNRIAKISNSQNSFKYFAGVNFTFGGK